MTVVFIAPVVPPVERDIALSLKFELVSCSWEVSNVVDFVVADCRDSKWLAKRDEMRLMRASSSLMVGDDDERLDEAKGCCTIIFVGVSNSMSTGFDCGDVNNDVDDGKSKLEPSPAVESGKLLTYCIERKKRKLSCI